MLLSATMLGYTVMDLDENFLQRFTHPAVQFVLMVLAASGLYDVDIRAGRFDLLGVLSSAAVMTVILQIMKRTVARRQAKRSVT